ncbi:MAG: hypothetical protein D6804_02795, partial [Aquificota bacterium]
LLYERKLIELLLGKLKPEDLMKDKKAHLIQPLLSYARELSQILGIEYGQDTEGIKKLLETLRLRVEEFKRVSSLMKTLLFENLDHQEYMSLVKRLESIGEKTLLKAMETRDVPVLLKNLWSLTERGILTEFRDAFEKLGESHEPAVRDFFRHVVLSSEKEMREAYRAFLEYMERSENLLEFYNSKGQHMESLLSRLEFINNLQWLMTKHGEAFYLPVYYEGGRGGLMFRSGREYSVVFRFEYGEGFLAGLLRMPRSGGLLDVLLFTDMENLAEKIRSGKHILDSMLSEEKIKLRSFSVSVSTRENVAEAVRSAYGEGFLLLA